MTYFSVTLMSNNVKRKRWIKTTEEAFNYTFWLFFYDLFLFLGVVAPLLSAGFHYLALFCHPIWFGFSYLHLPVAYTKIDIRRLFVKNKVMRTVSVTIMSYYIVRYILIPGLV